MGKKILKIKRLPLRNNNEQYIFSINMDLMYESFLAINLKLLWTIFAKLSEFEGLAP